MTELPLVSVLMTCYNREKYIGVAIESVLASTYTNFELIIVDDVSSDSSYEIAKSYTALDKRIRIYQNEKKLGDYPNRNKAAAYAQGAYLKYLDSDDLIYPHSLQIFLEAALKHKEAALIFTDGVLQSDYQPYPIKYYPEHAYIKHFFDGGLFFSGPGGTLIRRDAFIEVGGFSGKNMIGDQELWMRLALQYPIVCIQPGLIWWRIHAEQQFKIGTKDATYQIERYRVNKQFLEKAPISKDLVAKGLRNIEILFYRNILFKYLLKGKLRIGVNLLNKANLSIIKLLIAGSPIIKFSVHEKESNKPGILVR